MLDPMTPVPIQPARTAAGPSRLEPSSEIAGIRHSVGLREHIRNDVALRTLETVLRTGQERA
jgi:hypothetical protein